MEHIKNNILYINNRIKALAQGRKITFVAVTKTFPAEYVQEALNTGTVFDIAENKIQEALPKFSVLSDKLNGINRHFIGHLQSNKAKKAVLNFDLIQSLDSINLADDIDRHAKDACKIQKCLIELKVSGEVTKTGASKDNVYVIYEHCKENCKNISVCGIMTMAPFFENKELARPYFKEAYGIFKALKDQTEDENFNILSMGMSEDYEIAIQEGSNMVRIGSAVFGERNYDK